MENTPSKIKQNIIVIAKSTGKKKGGKGWEETTIGQEIKEIQLKAGIAYISLSGHFK